ncbi:MAG: hypothetical protein M9921_04330 [Fimbriimonadaceae bacterium]|nr:hypothetical protein [Chthonomonadaceae bacterium]MCO5296063.1 hypothetical protein [Fimbriimonadaceae bacterium]
MPCATQSLEQALEELQKVAPDAPFLALGQTVLWDEPMKGGIALASARLGYKRKLVAGVHDTDYFAKIPSGERKPGRFATLPHNDTTTKELWSAAAEFSALFGSETVVTREALIAAGLKLGKVLRERPHLLDEATEAWGWRGVVSLDEHPPITAEVPLRGLLPELEAAFAWALDRSVACLSGDSRADGLRIANDLRDRFCAAAEGPDSSLAGFYRRLLPELYAVCAGQEIPLEVTATTELLRFNTDTCRLPRFDLLRRFIEPDSRATACQAYNEAIASSEMYDLSRFGTGAIPFDLVIPGLGRGTLRIAPRAIVVMTREPQFITLSSPVETVDHLAEAVERKFGKHCTLVGKAVTLIGMLASEFTFVFHEGASSYVSHSRELHQKLAAADLGIDVHPILRVRYRAWDNLRTCCTWLKLPEPLQGPFGAEEVCAPTFATRWREVAQEQESVLHRLGELSRPIDLIRHLDHTVGGFWNQLAAEYEQLHTLLEGLKSEIESLRQERFELVRTLRELKGKRVAAERAKGAHWRQRVFEKSPTEEDLQERERLGAEVEHLIHTIAATENAIHRLRRQQADVVSRPDVLAAHARRREIEAEAELKRVHLIRQAVIASRGLHKAGLRPSAWWFPLLCPDGLWFRATVDDAECYLEPLV